MIEQQLVCPQSGKLTPVYCSEDEYKDRFKVPQVCKCCISTQYFIVGN